MQLGEPGGVGVADRAARAEEDDDRGLGVAGLLGERPGLAGGGVGEREIGGAGADRGGQVGGVSGGREGEHEECGPVHARLRDWGVGDGVRHRLARNLEGAVVAQASVHAIAFGVGGQRRDSVALVFGQRPQQRPAAQDRDLQRIQDRVAPPCRTDDQLGLELARRGVEPGVQDPRIRPAGGQARLGLRLQQDDLRTAAGKGERRRRTDDSGPHDGYLGIHAGPSADCAKKIIDIGPASGLWCARQTFWMAAMTNGTATT